MTLKVAITHRFDRFALDVMFEAGSRITALFGRSGAGKTTVINAVAGLLKPDGGSIELDGQRLSDDAVFVPPHQRGLGYVFQDARLFPHLDVRENLTFGAKYAAPKNDIQFDDVVDLLALGALLSQGPATLSGGEKQRVALGRALLCQPRMLLMDEPLTNLDGPRKQEILRQ